MQPGRLFLCLALVPILGCASPKPVAWLSAERFWTSAAHYPDEPTWGRVMFSFLPPEGAGPVTLYVDHHRFTDLPPLPVIYMKPGRRRIRIVVPGCIAHEEDLRVYGFGNGHLLCPVLATAEPAE